MHRKLAKLLDGRSSNVNTFLIPVHFQYAKSARFYFQLMDELPIDSPWPYNLFQQGYYAIKRSDRY